ncbi:Hint domain-containing protein [Halocynthiibacter sp.]|uniref:Hint domain-containing protein n=1 Tax=Halocynthiibacter sp. TaxID=1979210 RepID=UPI003C393CE3
MPLNFTGPGSITGLNPPYSRYLYNNGNPNGAVNKIVLDDASPQGPVSHNDTNGNTVPRQGYYLTTYGDAQGFAPGGPDANVTETGFTGNGTLLDVTFDPNMTTYKSLYVRAGYRLNTSIEYFRVTLPPGWTHVVSPDDGTGNPSDWGGESSMYNTNQANTAVQGTGPNHPYGTFRTQMFIYNASGTKVANLQFQQFDNGGGGAVFGGGSPCFVKGTKIKMADGTLKNVEDIEDIEAGDWVASFDNGPREVIWSGQHLHRKTELEQFEKLRPVRIPEGAIGNKKTTFYSPLHQVMLTSEQADLLFGTGSEVLVMAKSLVEVGVAFIDEPDDVTYCHIMFDDHELIQSDGIWTESFNPGVEALNSLTQEAREEVLTIFPELETQDAKGFTSVRPKLSKKEVTVLFSSTS